MPSRSRPERPEDTEKDVQKCTWSPDGPEEQFPVVNSTQIDHFADGSDFHGFGIASLSEARERSKGLIQCRGWGSQEKNPFISVPPERPADI